MACRQVLGTSTCWFTPICRVTCHGRQLCKHLLLFPLNRPNTFQQWGVDRLRPLSSLRGIAQECKDTSRSRHVVQTVSVSTVSTDLPTASSPVVNGTQPTDLNISAPTFQEAIARLQEYWSSVGCAVWLPHNTEVGAGTMNPATFLRVMGPEPWNVCYAEPSVRPDDSRYGDNPNRVQRHTQFQVILKPDPGNPQELYLASLEALGIDTQQHDVRFVEDNWESPVLGAWGLGWEVWLDGMEVTQFTYFQQAGGKALDVPAVEITYGMERILMALQGVKHFKDIRYTGSITYGEMFLQNEYEMSCYNLDEAHVEEQRQRFQLFEMEARRLLAKRLPIPAYDHLLKLSHTFNILDARGAVGVTERANCFAAMRGLAREVTGLWLARREEQGHPLGTVPSPNPLPPSNPTSPKFVSPQKLVLEIGSEELPPEDVESAIEQLRALVPPLLSTLRLTHGSVSVEGTPRRLSVVVEDVAAKQTDAQEKVRGPPAKVAFDASGTATKALEGFCRKNKVSVEDCTVEADGKGVEYVWAVVKEQGRTAAQVLTESLPGVLSSLSFKKSMRWRGGTAYSRPLRWLLALHGDTCLPFNYANLQASNVTRLLRNGAQPELQVASADDYLSTLSSAGILVNTRQRRDVIWSAVQQLSAEVGGTVPQEFYDSLLPEVLQLVEAPTVVMGSFSEAFLQLPREVLVMVMKKHQRYFPVYDAASGHLQPNFITVANGPVHIPTVGAGNEAVLRARFEDATFFYNDDLKTTLKDFRPRLKGTLFQKDLGSLLDKSDRTVQLIQPLAQAMGLEASCEVAKEAAFLARADLATATVMEMTALAGTMGRHYALQEGLPEAVADAIFESVLPRFAGDEVPKHPAGILVAVADRLDSLVGLFAAEGVPRGNADPFGLRRSAYGMLQALVTNHVPLDLRAAVRMAAEVQPIAVSQDTQDAVVEFVERRLEQLLVDSGVQVEAVRSILNERGRNAALAASSARQLQRELAKGEEGPLPAVLTTLARPTRITRSNAPPPGLQVDPRLFQCAEETALYESYNAVAAQITPDIDIQPFLAACRQLVAPVDAFFAHVFVMCEEEDVKMNRLALLRDVAAVSSGVMDFSELPGF